MGDTVTVTVVVAVVAVVAVVVVAVVVVGAKLKAERTCAGNELKAATTVNGWCTSDVQ